MIRATFEWNRSPEDDVAGYRLKFNGEQLNDVPQTEVGTNPQAVVTFPQNEGMLALEVAPFDNAEPANVAAYVALAVRIDGQAPAPITGLRLVSAVFLES